MSVKKSILLGLGVGNLFLAAVALAGPGSRGSALADTKAKSLLKQLMINGERIPLNAIVVQRTGRNNEMSFQFTVTQDRQGRRQMVAIKPLVAQGMVSYDDGSKWVNYYPDENRMVVLPSPRGDREDVEDKLKLAGQNYRFAVESGATVAGRPASIVVAIPKFEGMPLRRIAIDSSNNVLLRIESQSSAGKREAIFDVKSIEFKTCAGFAAAYPTRPSCRVFKPVAPVRITDLATAKASVGFTPFRVDRLAQGFVVRDAAIVGTSNQKWVAMRLTDGLVNGTLYQYPTGTRPMGPNVDGMEWTYKNVTFRLVGDFDQQTKALILRSLAKNFGRTFEPTREPLRSQPALTPKRDPEIFLVEIVGIEQALAELERLIESFEFDDDDDLGDLRDGPTTCPSNFWK